MMKLKNSLLLAGALALVGCPAPQPEVPSGPAPAASVAAPASAGPSDGDAAVPGPLGMQVRGLHMDKARTLKSSFGINDVLHSGDFVAYEVWVDRPAYVYILQFFPDGSQAVHHPATEEPTKLEARTWVRVPPDARDWLELDDATGQENLYIVASIRPLDAASPELKSLIDRVRTSPQPGGDEQDAAAMLAETKVQLEQPKPTPVAAPVASRPLPAPRPVAAGGGGFLRARGVKPVRVEGAGGVEYKATTGADGVGIFPFPFQHDP